MTEQMKSTKFCYTPLRQIVPKLVEEAKKIWWESQGYDIRLRRRYDLKERKKREKELQSFLADILKHFANYPYDLEEQKDWTERLASYIEEVLLEYSFAFGDIYGLLDEDFIHSTKQFIKKARKFDETLKNKDIFQALRNVWIVNMVQKMSQKKPGISHSIFAYSMLYLYTDNFLDDKEISQKEKEMRMERFTKRLEGQVEEVLDQRERKLWDLVESVEFDYKRDLYYNVYESLLSIQEAQVKSMLQEGDFGPFDRDILGISFEKGGTSVVADAYLALGELTYEEILFHLCYGIALQLADDLQDVKEDLDNKHMTVFSIQAGIYPLEETLEKLLSFTERILENKDIFSFEGSEELKDTIQKNIDNLILFSGVEHLEYFSPEYQEYLKESIPFPVGFQERIKRKIQKKRKKILERFEGLDMEEIILEAFLCIARRKEERTRQLRGV